MSTFNLTCAAATIDRATKRAFVAVGDDEKANRIEAITLCGMSGGRDCDLKVSICDE